MSDPRGWPFDSPDLIRIPFIFVPHGDPWPVEWLAEHPEAIRIPARFVPRRQTESGLSDRLEVDWEPALTKWLAREVGDEWGADAAPVDAAGQVTHRQNGLPIALAALPDQHDAAGPVDSHAPSPGSSGPPAKPMTEAEILKLARMRAMLRLIKWEENGPVSDDTAYHARFGGRDPMSDGDMLNYQPKPEYFRFDGRLEPFTAAGAYQILGDTWRRISKILGTSDFTPENQDRAAIVLIDEYRGRRCRGWQIATGDQ